MSAPSFYILSGLPGVGKSHARKTFLASIPVVDCDEIKQSLPGYDPNNPGSEPSSTQQQIPFNLTSGFTQVFNSGLSAADPLQFNIFYHASAKVLSPLNAYTGLYESAQDNFEDDSIFPEIELTDVDTTPEGETPIDTDADGVRDT
ncbi:MAG TPA: hypothetical protein PLJ11_04510, partial [Methanomassiliicoccales archaeon]|nr:hypothetical protein [Methanomassiliicoccales archaeon]